MKLLADQSLFWDTDLSTLNEVIHAQSIIERVLERGSWENIKELIQHYGCDKIAEAIQNASWFSDKTIYFVSGYFNIPLKDLRCYTEKQSNPIPYL